ncbi:MAG: NADP-dependent oxidoreductase [Acidimicrobiales bacterium]|jgi:NADPH:quinone reductase-like Zn-dependent oxidoreductase
MPRAVKFEKYGDVDVLEVVDVPRPVPGPGQVLVRVRAAGINIGEAKIRQGLLEERWPATFPSGQGSDLAGVVEEVGPGVTEPAVGHEVLGHTDGRASQADYVVVEAVDVVPKPPAVPWEVAGSLFVAGTTAYATVRAVSVGEGDTLVVAGAAGGVGSIAVQLASMHGASVIGLAGAANHQWLRDHGVVPVSYGDGTIERIGEVADRVDAFIDAFGNGYVEMALELGVEPSRIDTIVNFAAVERYGIKAEGSATAADPKVLSELAGLVAADRLEVPIASTYPLGEVREAYRQLESGHGRGKIVLLT